MSREKASGQSPVACSQMNQHLIRRTDGEDGGDRPIHGNRFPDILRPNTMPSTAVDGMGDHPFDVTDVKASFSRELVGRQVTFCGASDQETAGRIVSEIAANLAAAVRGQAPNTQIDG